MDNEGRPSHSIDIGAHLKHVPDPDTHHAHPRAPERAHHAPDSGPTRFFPVFCLLVILLAGGISLWQSTRLLVLNDLAEQLVEQQNLQDAQREIAQGYPLANPLEQSRLVAQRAQEVKKRPLAQQRLAAATAHYQSLYRTRYGLPYAYYIDSYSFLARAEGIAAGADAPSGPFVALESALYRFLKPQDDRITPSDAAFFLPFALGLLALVLFFFLAQQITGSTTAALFAGIVRALHHQFFLATAAGMEDSQSINLLFSVLFFLLCILAARAWPAHKRRAGVWAALAALTFLVFRQTWNAGAWYVLLVLAAAACAFFAIRLARQRSWTWLGLLAACAAVAGIAVSVTPIGMRFLSYLKLAPQTPFVQQIAELQSQDFPAFVAGLGGWVLLTLAACAWLVIAYKNVRQKPAFPEIFVLVWFALMVFATAQAQRFVYYALSPLAILVGIAAAAIADRSLGFLSEKHSWQGTLAAQCVMVALIALVMAPALSTAAHQVLPTMNDAFAKVGSDIERHAAPDARIISWWDYGHVWRYAARRQPYLDGGGTGSKGERWLIGRALLSQDPAEAKQLLNALACNVSRQFVPGSTSFTPALLANSTSCATPTQAFVAVNEGMLSIAPQIAELVSRYDSTFTAPDIETTRVVQCAVGSDGLDCGGLAINVTSLTATGGLPVYFVANGTRMMPNASGDRVLVVFLSGKKLAAFAASAGFANTALVRLFTGENLGMVPVSVADDPIRIVAYKLA